MMNEIGVTAGWACSILPSLRRWCVKRPPSPPRLQVKSFHPTSPGACRVRRINFTGSPHVGRIIAKRAAEYLKPCLLELGGKAPLIVLEDADLDEAVKAAAFGAFMNHGHRCMSTERVIVIGAVAQAFTERFTAKAQSMVTGDPRDGSAQLSAVVDQKTVKHVNGLIDDAVAKGATLLSGGKANSILMPATVVDGVTSDMALYHDESFGPVVAVIHARDADHAIELANDSEYGLSAAVFTRDIVRGLKVARQIHSGICHINGATVHDELQMPFGGVGASGHGRFGGRQGIDSLPKHAGSPSKQRRGISRSDAVRRVTRRRL